MPSGTKGRYRALVGMNFMPRGGKEEVRVEAGGVVEAMALPPKADVAALVEQGTLEPLEGAGEGEDDG